MREVSRCAIARVRNQIHLRVTRHAHVPTVGLHRNVVLQQVPRLGAPVNTPPPSRLLCRQPPIHLSRADAQQLLLDLRTHPKAFADPRHPRRQQRLQSHRPRIACRFPHRRQYGQGLLTVTHPAPPPLLPPFLRPRPVQQPNGILPVIAGVGAKFTQNHVLTLASRQPVALINSPQVLPPPFVPQPDPPPCSVLVGLHFRWRDTLSSARGNIVLASSSSVLNLAILAIPAEEFILRMRTRSCPS